MIRPLRNDVIFKKKESILSTESGILLHNPVEPDKAVTVAVGPNVTQISVGDIFIADWSKSTQLNDLYYKISEQHIFLVYGNIN